MAKRRNETVWIPVRVDCEFVARTLWMPHMGKLVYDPNLPNGGHRCR